MLNNTRKLQKYGSVLGYNALPKMKSLVLKDLVDPGKNEESSDDDDGSEGSENKLSKKLQNALLQQHSSDDEHEFSGDIGLFNNQGGLQQLIKNSVQNESKSKSDNADGYEIEIAPQRLDPLPYVPDGYSPFRQEDIQKLKSFNSPYELDLEDDGGSTDKVDLLPLEAINEESEQDEIVHIAGDREEGTPLPLLSKNLRKITAIPTIESLCNGEGLDPEELEDLIT